MLPRGAILINAARGEVLDVDAALAALARNDLGGLALDVFDPEPPHAQLARRSAPHPHAAHRRLHARGEERDRGEAVRNDLALS